MIITDLLETGVRPNSSSYTQGTVQGTQYAPLQIKTGNSYKLETLNTARVLGTLYHHNRTGNVHGTYNIDVCSRNHCCCGKSISITYRDCVFVASAIQHTNCMPCIILSSVACLVPPHFSILSHKWHNFQKKKSKELKMRGFISSTMCETFLILRRIQ